MVKAVALYDFDRQDAAQLSFREGEELLLVAQEGDWWRAESPTGEGGWIPANYIQIVADQDVKHDDLPPPPPAELAQVQVALVREQLNFKAEPVVANNRGGNVHALRDALAQRQDPAATTNIQRTNDNTEPTAAHKQLAVANPPVQNVIKQAAISPVAGPARGANCEAGAKIKSDAQSTKNHPNDPHAKVISTGWGLFASNMAYISAFMLLIVGIGSVINGTVDNTDSRSTIRIAAGVYAVALSMGITAFEWFWGCARDPTIAPWRTICYIPLSVFLCFGTLTVFAAPAVIVTGLANLVSWYLKEDYDIVEETEREASKPKPTDRLEEDDLNLNLTDRMFHWYAAKQEKNKVGETVFLSGFALINIFLFVYNYLTYRANHPMSAALPAAKGFGLMLDFLCVIVLVPVMRTFIRSLYNRSTETDDGYLTKIIKTILYFVPLDKHLKFHRFVAWCIVGATVGHVISHAINYSLNPNTAMKTFGLWPWVTGGFILTIMVIMYGSALPSVKDRNFELFWYPHHLFIAFYFFNLIHGRGGLGPNFWKFLLLPGLMYAYERFLRWRRSNRPVFIRSFTLMKPNIMCLELEPPFGKNGYKEGQYVFLNCPYVSPGEWHPFTISSAPQDDSMTMHIRVHGEDSWTRQVMNYMLLMGNDKSRIDFTRMGPEGKPLPGKSTGPDGRPIFCIDGPHSAPTQHVSEYDTVMLVGAGIGLTPMASTLRSVIQYRLRLGYNPKNVYFYWVCAWRDIDAFQWFIRHLKEVEDELYHLRSSARIQGVVEMHVFVTSVGKGTRESEHLVVDAEKANNRRDSIVRNGAPFTYDELYNAMDKPAADHTQLGDIHIWRERPNWDEQFQHVTQSFPRGKVGVPFCGPPAIAKALKAACHKHSSAENGRFFVLHKEVF